MLDTDCTDVGTPAVSFLSDWLSCINKFNSSADAQNFIATQQNNIHLTMDIVVKRIAYPDWCDIDNFDDDDAQIEYQKYREVLIVLLRNLSLVKSST